MKKQHQLTTAGLKRQQTMKNFYYNRYLLLRYLLAIFFFTNLYWFLGLLMSQSSLMLLPLMLLGLSIPAISEHVKLYGEDRQANPLKLQANRLYYLIQLVTNVGIGLMALTNSGFTELFPFFKNSTNTRFVVLAVLLMGGMLAIIGLKRIQHIGLDRDKHYQYIKELEKTI